MLKDCLANNRMFCVAMQRPDTSREIPSPIAGVGLIRACVTKKDGTSNLILQGIARVRLVKTTKYRPYRVCRTEWLGANQEKSAEVQGLTSQLLELLSIRLKQGFAPPLQKLPDIGNPEPKAEPNQIPDPTIIQQGLEFMAKISDPDHLADLVSCSLLPNPLERQAILETPDLETRLKILIQFLTDEIARIKKPGGSKEP